MPFINQPIIDINAPYNRAMEGIGQGLGAAAGGFMAGRAKQNRFQELARKLGLNEQEAAEFQVDPKGVLERQAKNQPVEIGEAHAGVLDRTMPLQPKTFRTPTAGQIRESTPDSTYIQPTGEANRPYGSEAPFGKDARTGGSMTPEALEGLLSENATVLQSWANKTVRTGELDDLLRAGTTLYGTDQRAKTAQEMAELRALLYEDRQNRQDERMREQQANIDRRFQQGSNVYLPMLDAEGNALVGNTRGSGEIRSIPTPSGGKLQPRVAPTIPGEFVTKLQQIDTMKESFNKVRELYDPSYIGPIAGPFGKLQEKTGLGADPKRAEFRSYVANMFNTMIYLRSGKQINQEEAVRLADEFISMNRSDEDFAGNLAKMEHELSSIENNLKQQLGAAGYRNFAPGGAPPAQQTPSGQETKVLNGKTYIKINGAWYEQ